MMNMFVCSSSLEDGVSEETSHKVCTWHIGRHVQVDVACALQVWIKHAEQSIYVAEIDGCMLMKMGPAKYQPEEANWRSVASGHHWEIWEKGQQH